MKGLALRIAAFVLGLALLAPGCDAQKPVRFTYRVDQVLRHDTGAYTQGLFFNKGRLYESTGQYGSSSMRIVDLASGKVVKMKSFPRRYFIEGSCILGNNLYVLSWQERTCFVLDPETFEQKRTFAYQGEGWGLTTDGQSLIMSDGTDRIYFRDPASFQIRRQIKVTFEGRSIAYLNELEYIEGEIWANVYGSDVIVRIRPSDGVITSIVDCSDILPNSLRTSSTDVLNGIAYNPETGYIYVTGKYWPKMYRISAVRE